MDKISEKGIETNKSFWKFIKPSLTNKGIIASNDITLIDGKKVITDEYEISETLTNLILTLSKKVAEKNLVKQVPHQGLQITVISLTKLLNHKTIQVCSRLKTSLTQTNSFDFQQIKAPEVKKRLKETDFKKAVGIDTIPLKYIKIVQILLHSLYCRQ